MIKYNLDCSCGEKFESWFQSSNEYDKLSKKNLISCYACGSTKDVKKSLMAPNVISSNKSEVLKKNNQKKEFYINVKEKLKDLRKYVEKNAEYVGDNFASEARSIHYDNKKKRSIYGTVSEKDKSDLISEGIDVVSIPWINNQN